MKSAPKSQIRTPQAANDQPASIRDVAQRAGVSPGSVSNVINGRRRQDDAIGRAVLRAAKELDYHANTIASNLRRTKSRIIGLVIPDFENAFFAQLVAALEQCAEQTGYRLVSTSSRENEVVEAREVRELIGWRVAGLLIAPALAELDPANPPIEKTLIGGHVPSVIFDRIPPASHLDCVGVNNEDASAEVVERLIALGHRRILVAYSQTTVNNAAERLKGVRRAIEAASAQVDASYVACGPTVETSKQALEVPFAAPRLPTAVFCLNNLAGLAAYGLLSARGCRAGVDVAMVCFDDSAWMAQMAPPVAAIVQPVEEIAKAAWESLMDQIEGRRDSARLQRLPCRLEERGTLVPPSDKAMDYRNWTETHGGPA